MGDQKIELYAIDEAGNWAFCLASVFIQDSSGKCGSGLVDSTDVATVAGGIFNANRLPLAGVTLRAKGTVLFEKTVTTDESGSFSMDLPKGIGYIITPEKSDDPMNGITVYDLVIVQRHILDLEAFKTPYQYIAADMDRSGSVSTFDVVQMRKMILGIAHDFANDSSWRFVKNTYDFTTENPAEEAFKESIFYTRTGREFNRIGFYCDQDWRFE